MKLKEYSATRAILIWMAYASTERQDAILSQASAEGHVCVCGVAIADVCDPCYLRGP